MSEIVIDGQRRVAGPELTEWPAEMPEGSVWEWTSEYWKASHIGIGTGHGIRGSGGWISRELWSGGDTIRRLYPVPTEQPPLGWEFAGEFHLRSDGGGQPRVDEIDETTALFYTKDLCASLRRIERDSTDHRPGEIIPLSRARMGQPDANPDVLDVVDGRQDINRWLTPGDRFWIVESRVGVLKASYGEDGTLFLLPHNTARYVGRYNDVYPDAGKMVSVPEPPPKDEGEAVTPRLIRWLVEHVDGRDDDWDFYDAIQLVRQRHAYGLAKYGQPLKTGDGRDTIEDARQEAGDLLQYLWKARMQGLNLSQFRGLLRVALAIVEGEG